MQVTDVQGPAVLVLAADEVKTIREATEIWRGWSGTKMMCDSIMRTLIQAADAWERRNLDHIAVTKQCETLAAERDKLRAALTLAANRMDVLALDHEYGTTRRNIADDWAKEARAALGPNVRAERPTPAEEKQR